MTIIEGNTVRLRCTSTGGDPPPVTSWYKNGNSLPISDRQSVLVTGELMIENPVKEDEGQYVCQVTNAAGSIEYRVTLNILG